MVSAGNEVDSLSAVLNSATDPKKQRSVLFELGTAYANDGKFNEAINSFNRLIRLVSNGHNSLLAKTHNEIGNSYADLGNNVKAINAYQKALSVAPEKALSLRAKVNKNIGAVFLSWKNLDKALHYYKIAQNLAIEGNDKITEADCLNNKGTVYEQQNNFAKAFEVYNRALKIYKEAKLHPRIALTYNNLAILSKVKKDFKSASEYYRQSVVHAENSDNPWLTAAISTNLGNLLTEAGQLTEGQAYLKKALFISKKIDAKELIYETLENLAENASRRKDFSSAYSYHKQFSKAQSDFINIENTKEVAKLQAEFDVEKKEKALATSKAQVLQSQLEISRKSTFLNSAILGLIAVASLALLVFRNSKIQQQKLKLENEFNLKLASAEARNQLQEEKLRISRELHDNIGSQLTFINSSIQNLNNTYADSEVLTETWKITQNTISELRRTVWLINKQEVNLDEFVVKLRDYVKPMQANSPHFIIDIGYTGQCSLNSLTATNLFRIIQEGINNAVKYSEASLLKVNLNCTEQSLTLSIVDNGIGFDEAAISEGYGIKNIKARVEALKGSCSINSAPGKGTNVYLSIPV